MRKIKSKIGLLLICFLSCLHYSKYIPNPERDIANWIKNFSYQKSLAYEYQLKTRFVEIKCAGKCRIGWGEYVKGVWEYPESSYHFEYIGIKDREWMKKGKEWEESARGEESDIFSQIERVMEFDKFEYLNSEGNFYYFRFKPNVPFLDPARRDEMVGFLWISKKTFLPEIIWAGLPDSSVWWRVKISDLNRSVKISPPLSRMIEYEVLFDSTGPEINQSIKMLKNRLGLLNVPFKLVKMGKKIILKFPSYYQIDDVKEMLGPGRFFAYNVADDKSGAIKSVYFANEPRKPIYVSKQVFGSDDVKSCEIKFDNLKRPFILIHLKRDSEFSKRVAFELNGSVVAITELDNPQKLNKIFLYPDMRYLQINLLKGFISQPLPEVEIKMIAKE
uniref:Uncharacterized protein n=1 Tax=candidate division WOR-3 bacterium TaxID=2052148 RepID=A0A7C4TIX9_UNCW3